MILEEKVTLEPQELSGHLAFAAANNLGNGDLGIVIADPRRNTIQEREDAGMALQKGLRALPWKGLNVDRIGIRERHHEQRHLRLFAVEEHVGKPEIDLSFSGPVTQRQKDFALLLFPGRHRFLDDRFAAFVPMLVAETFKDTLAGVTLFPMNLPVTLQDLVNDRQERFQLRWPRPTPPIARRFRVRENLLERIPMNPRLGARSTLADLVAQDPATDLSPFLHIREHPCLLLWSLSEHIPSWRV